MNMNCRLVCIILETLHDVLRLSVNPLLNWLIALLYFFPLRWSRLRAIWDQTNLLNRSFALRWIFHQVNNNWFLSLTDSADDIAWQVGLLRFWANSLKISDRLGLFYLKCFFNNLRFFYLFDWSFFGLFSQCQVRVCKAVLTFRVFIDSLKGVQASSWVSFALWDSNKACAFV